MKKFSLPSHEGRGIYCNRMQLLYHGMSVKESHDIENPLPEQVIPCIEPYDHFDEGRMGAFSSIFQFVSLLLGKSLSYTNSPPPMHYCCINHSWSFTQQLKSISSGFGGPIDVVSQLTGHIIRN
jgi:hypothetical protein